MAVWRSAGNVHLGPFCFFYFFNKDSFHLFSFSLKCDLWRSPCLLFGPKKSLHYIIFFGGFLKHCNYSIRISLMLHFFLSIFFYFFIITHFVVLQEVMWNFSFPVVYCWVNFCVFFLMKQLLALGAFGVQPIIFLSSSGHKWIIPVFFFIFCL